MVATMEGSAACWSPTKSMRCMGLVANDGLCCLEEVLLQSRTHAFKHGSFHTVMCTNVAQTRASRASLSAGPRVKVALRLQRLVERHADQYPRQQLQVCMCEQPLPGVLVGPVGQAVQQ